MKKIVKHLDQVKINESDERIIRLRKNWKKHCEKTGFKLDESMSRQVIFKKSISKERFYEIANVVNYDDFILYMKHILFKKEERESFYKRVAIEHDMFKDTFSCFDFGLDKLIISEWKEDCLKQSPFTYDPSKFFYHKKLKVKDEDVLLLLLHSLIMRGMNADVVHVDSNDEAKQVYFVQNDKNDFMSFSSINIMPHSEACLKEFDLEKWADEDKLYIESTKEKNWMWGEVIF